MDSKKFILCLMLVILTSCFNKKTNELPVGSLIELIIENKDTSAYCKLKDIIGKDDGNLLYYSIYLANEINYKQAYLDINNILRNGEIDTTTELIKEYLFYNDQKSNK